MGGMGWREEEKTTTLQTQNQHNRILSKERGKEVRTSGSERVRNKLDDAFADTNSFAHALVKTTVE